MFSTLLHSVALLSSAMFGVNPDQGAQHLAASAVTAEQEPLNLQFGVYRTDKASTMYRTFLPVIEQMQDELESKLERPVEIELKIFKTYEEGLTALVKGDVDFVRFGPASYVLAKRLNKNIELLAMEHKKGKKLSKGVIVVKTDSPYRTLTDLKGASFAFGDQNSTIGRYLAQAELIRAGVHERDLSEHKFLGRHDLVAKSVELGDYDAGSLKISTFDKMNTDGKMRVLHSFDNVTKPWIAREGLGETVTSALTDVMLNWQDMESLSTLKISGWLASSDSEYAFVREGMTLAEKKFTVQPAKK